MLEIFYVSASVHFTLRHSQLFVIYDALIYLACIVFCHFMISMIWIEFLEKGTASQSVPFLFKNFNVFPCAFAKRLFHRTKKPKIS